MFAHAEPVIDNANEIAPARCNDDFDVARFRINRIFNEFFDRRGRPFDDFPRRDAVDQNRIKFANGHQHLLGGPNRAFVAFNLRIRHFAL